MSSATLNIGGTFGRTKLKGIMEPFFGHKLYFQFFPSLSPVNYYQCNNFSSQTYNIMSFEIDAFHTHYAPLSIDGHNNRSNVHCQILPIETTSLHMQHGPMSKNAHMHEDKLQYGITPMTNDRNNRVNVVY